ncbi:MAG: hypothetical protein COX90_03565 [Candidatus Nealsonbacteria bacterium CG_4_10_14_0_2_um_filter_38_17]|uniref:4-vinyl reductase 4VR domain-containing protein n=2 Tax=Candidatus Nealsoniibacteriota TaxID=1817911 RepID=A0A2M7UXE6_9BACT|nr:MAG: hypothetical protein COX36_03680 [Candidatus Nealsonbacteria bacterium CG23_combo_of_CG06-09_8_20_14_all_38_19]PIZ88639.1 MAG: hypothetical protein COX90_03565 [Candidatus Nealsonbacteria bacterium CG_4_10_14_0_2_um_filter_38_17]
MEKEEITKELADKVMSLKGECRGICLKTDMDFLLKKKGKEGLRTMEEELEKLGYPIKYNKVNVGAFYPIGQDILDMLIIWKLFDYDTPIIKQLGYEAPNFSIFLKIFMKYLISMKETLKQAPAMQKEHYTVGELKVIEVDEDKKYVILRMENFDVHPFLCLALEGYFTKVCQMMIKSGRATCEETKCVFRGGNTHEFLLKW